MLKKIKTDNKSARIEKNTIKKNVLSTLIGEIEKANKSGKGDISDTEILKIIKKMVENNVTTNLQIENPYLECYLPTMIDEPELTKIVLSFVNDNNLSGTGMRSMGKIMKFLNQKYSGQFDGKLVSTIAQKLIN